MFAFAFNYNSLDGHRTKSLNRKIVAYMRTSSARTTVHATVPIRTKPETATGEGGVCVHACMCVRVCVSRKHARESLPATREHPYIRQFALKLKRVFVLTARVRVCVCCRLCRDMCRFTNNNNRLQLGMCVGVCVRARVSVQLHCMCAVSLWIVSVYLHSC